MPFTFSHPAIVLPFRYLPKRWVSITGLIIGSMVPDFEYFLRMRVMSIYSHTWLGLLWFDLPLGLLSLFIYQVIIKDTVILHLPTILNQRFSKYRGVDKPGSVLQYFIVAVFSILVGAASHIVWDGFTHPNGYFVSLLPVLSNTVQIGTHQFFIYKIIQHSSTIVGAAILVIAVYALPPSKSKANHHVMRFWLQIAVISIFVIVIRIMGGLSYFEYGNVIVTGIAGGFIGLIITSLTSNLKVLD